MGRGTTPPTAAPPTVKGLRLCAFAATRGVDAEYTRDENTQLQEDDCGSGSDHDGQGGAENLVLAILSSVDKH